MYTKIIVVLFLIFIIGSLFSGLFYLVKDKGQGRLGKNRQSPYPAYQSVGHSVHTADDRVCHRTAATAWGCTGLIHRGLDPLLQVLIKRCRSAF
jgi:hypothetical protein